MSNDILTKAERAAFDALTKAERAVLDAIFALGYGLFSFDAVSVDVDLGGDSIATIIGRLNDYNLVFQAPPFDPRSVILYKPTFEFLDDPLRSIRDSLVGDPYVDDDGYTVFTFKGNPLT